MHLNFSHGLPPITCSVKAAVAATDLGKDTIYKLINEGQLEAAIVGKRRLVFVDSLKAYLDACRIRHERTG